MYRKVARGGKYRKYRKGKVSVTRNGKSYSRTGNSITKRVSRVPTLYKNPMPFTGLYKFTFNIQDYSLVTTSIGGYGSAVAQFRGNSCYDPDYSGIGSQPYGWDQMTQLFNRYKVMSSKIAIYPLILTSAEYPATQCSILVFPKRDLAGLTNNQEMAYRRMPFVKGLNMRSADNNGKNKLESFAKTKWFYNTAPNDNDLTALVDNNPGKTWTWNIYVDSSAQEQICKLKYDIKITYYVQMQRDDSIYVS